MKQKILSFFFSTASVANVCIFNWRLFRTQHLDRKTGKHQGNSLSPLFTCISSFLRLPIKLSLSTFPLDFKVLEFSLKESFLLCQEVNKFSVCST